MVMVFNDAYCRHDVTCTYSDAHHTWRYTEVTAVTSLGDDVFVVRAESPQVEVHSAVTFTLQRSLSVRGLGGPCGLAA